MRFLARPGILGGTLLVALLLVGGGLGYARWFTQHVTSPYVTQLASPVRGLSAQEVDDLLAGRGAGYARSAELNSYPGPRHLLDLQTELALSAEQGTTLQATFDGMQAEARRLGTAIVAAEAALSEGFASGTLSEAAMQEQVTHLAGLYGQLRATHLQAHLQSRTLLTEEQVAGYNELRGYTEGAGANTHHSASHPSP